MTHTIFEWREDKEFGGNGWIPKGYPDFNAGDGLSIAHDTLEHFADGDGSLSAEMEAFGSMLYIRVQSGWFYSRGNARGAAPNMGSDIARFLQQMRWQDMNLRNPGRTYRLGDGLDDEIEAIITEGLRQANDEEAYSGDEVPFRYTRDWKIQYMVGWMRKGYRRCKQRWHDAGPHQLSYLFDRIVRDVDDRFRTGDFGDELHVRVNNKTLEHSVTRRYAEDFYD